MTNNTTNRKAIFALMLVLFIDGMGQGIIFPILTGTISNPHSHVMLNHASEHVRSIWYGILVAAYFLMWFLSATVLGDWSDNVGRKKALMLCLVLAGVSFILSGLAFDIHSLTLLLFARILGGVTSGDQAIAQAAVIDLCDPKKKAVYLGLVLLSVTLGLVVGPLIGAYLINPHVVSWFNLKTPFYFATLITIINIILLWIFFSETRVVKTKKHRIQWTRSLHIFIEAFKHKAVRYLLFSYLLAQTGWAMFYVYTPSFITIKYHTSEASTGVFLAFIGFGLGIGLGVLPSLTQKLKHQSVACLGYLCVAATCFGFIFSNHLLPMWIIIIPATALLGVAYANILPLFSEAVSADRQGWIMGVTGSIIAFSAGVDSLISGPLASIMLSFPYIFSCVLMIIGAIMVLFYKHHSTER